MYRAYFKYAEEEPEEMYFQAPKNDIKRMEFKAEVKEPIKFIISENKTLEVES